MRRLRSQRARCGRLPRRGRVRVQKSAPDTLDRDIVAILERRGLFDSWRGQIMEEARKTDEWRRLEDALVETVWDMDHVRDIRRGGVRTTVEQLIIKQLMDGLDRDRRARRQVKAKVDAMVEDLMIDGDLRPLRKQIEARVDDIIDQHLSSLVEEGRGQLELAAQPITQRLAADETGIVEPCAPEPARDEYEVLRDKLRDAVEHGGDMEFIFHTALVTYSHLNEARLKAVIDGVRSQFVVTEAPVSAEEAQKLYKEFRTALLMKASTQAAHLDLAALFEMTVAENPAYGRLEQEELQKILQELKGVVET